jgi:hypothetical protein
MANERGTEQAEPLIQMGYPDFWPVILQKYEKFLAYANDLGPTIDEIFSQGHAEPLHTVCRHLAKMVANSLSAVLLLAVNGFGIDALKIGRTMFEAAVMTMISQSAIPVNLSHENRDARASTEIPVP